MRSITLVFGLCLVLRAGAVPAFPAILGDWILHYPESASDTAGCQLCHADSGGGQPWNAYGWDIREELQGIDVSNTEAFDRVAFDNQDNDSVLVNGMAVDVITIEEIRRDFQPGWTEGANNTLFFANETTTNNQLPPDDLPATTAIDSPDAIDEPFPDAIEGSATTLDLIDIATGFNSPVRAVRAPGINGSLFVVEQTGRIFRVDLATGTKTLFHDVSNDLVDLMTGFDERGLLGLAFHPDYQNNRLFYTYQSEPRRVEQDSIVDFSTAPYSGGNPDHRTMVVEYRASDASCNSSIRKRRTLLIIDQPQFNHNGGDLVFGDDGYLYISIGDGGNRFDVGPGHGLLGNGRNNNNVLGSILRIDPLGNNSANGRYGVPANNPFVGEDGVDEIFAFGLRNPYRMSFDAQTGDLYTGDVGQGDLEEINHIVSGGNYGWNWKEGSLFFYSPTPENSNSSYVSDVAPPNLPNDLIEPIAEYDRSEGVSVTGGYVYRGTSLDGNQGDYIFADFSGPNFGTATGRLFTLDFISEEIQELQLNSAINGYIAGFGQDVDNELYVVLNDQFNPSGQMGRLVKLTELGDPPTSPDAGEETAQCPPSEDLCLPIKTQNDKIAVICL